MRFMENQPSSVAAVSPLTTSTVGGHIAAADSKLDQVLDNQLVVDENTFIIREDGGLIQVPAGTIATLLPDSDEETAAELQPVIKTCVAASVDSTVALDTPCTSVCQPVIKTCVAASVDSTVALDTPCTSVCQPVIKTCVTASVDSAVALDTPHTSVCQPVSDMSEVSFAMKEPLVSPVVENRSIGQTELDRESSNTACPDRNVTAEDGCVASTDSAVPSDSQTEVLLENSDDVAVSSDNTVNASISVSDLYVQEEEEVIDEVSVDADNSGVESPSVAKTTALSSVTKFDESSFGKTNKRAISKKQGKNSAAPQSELSKVTGSNLSATDKMAKMTTPSLPTLSASGRPQRSTPRRSAIDLLKGTDVKPIRRTVVEQDADQTPVKQAKLCASKKNTEQVSLVPLTEENAEDQIKRHCGTRGKNSETSLNTVADAQPRPASPVFKNILLEAGPVSVYGVENRSSDSLLIKKDSKNNESEATVTEKSGESRNLSSRNSKKKIESDKPDDLQVKRLRGSIRSNGSDMEEVNDSDSNSQNAEITNTVHGGGDDGIVLSQSRRKKSLMAACKGKKLSHCEPDNRDSEDADDICSNTKIFPAETHANSAVIDSEVDSSSENFGLPGFPYRSFMADVVSKKVPLVKSPAKNLKVRCRKEKVKNPTSGRDLLETSQAKLPNVESMQARIRELEDEVERLQVKLDELNQCQDKANSVHKRQISKQIAEKKAAVSLDMPSDDKSVLDRWENKLRNLDKELDEKRTELIIRLGCITRYERQVLEKERRLKRLEASLNLRKQQVGSGNTESLSNDSVTIKDVLMTGRVDVHAEERRLELRRQELERQKSFLDDEKKKLVVKERELETREQLVNQEQAAVDADLMSMANVFKSSDVPLTVVSGLKQSNGKIDVDFSDEDDDGFGVGSQQLDCVFSATLHVPSPDTSPEDDEMSEITQEDTPLSKMVTNKKRHQRSAPSRDPSVDSAVSNSDAVFTNAPSKRRNVDSEEDTSKLRKRAA